MFGIGFISIFAFQSPRSGQICSNACGRMMTSLDSWLSFNPLDRVKFVQINMGTQTLADVLAEKFQSPRSGQICSNIYLLNIK